MENKDPDRVCNNRITEPDPRDHLVTDPPDLYQQHYH
jgi:hypothetical protein